MLSTFLGSRQETTKTAFCNYLASEMDTFLDRDFKAFRSKAVKILSGMQSRTEERSRQPQQPQQKTLSRRSRSNSTFVPLTFQQPKKPAATARGYIVAIPEIQISASQIIKAATQRAADFLFSC